VHVSSLMDKLGLPWQFVDAVKGSLDVKDYDDARCRRYFGRSLLPGEIGCFLSHRKVWGLCLALQKPLLVVEDDIRIAGCLSGALKAAAECHLSWDLLRLAGIFPVRRKIVRETIAGTQLVELLANPCGTAAYLIKPAGARKLLAHSSMFFMPVDHYMEERYLHGTETLACWPYPLAGDAFDPATASTIGARSQGRPSMYKRIRRELYRAPYGIRRRLWQWMRLLGVTSFPASMTNLTQEAQND
jgi:glycosyl transferase family 25